MPPAPNRPQRPAPDATLPVPTLSASFSASPYLVESPIPPTFTPITSSRIPTCSPSRSFFASFHTDLSGFPRADYPAQNRGMFDRRLESDAVPHHAPRRMGLRRRRHPRAANSGRFSTAPATSARWDSTSCAPPTTAKPGRSSPPLKLPAATAEFFSFSIDARGAGSVTTHQEEDSAALPRGLYVYRTADGGKTWTGPFVHLRRSHHRRPIHLRPSPKSCATSAISPRLASGDQTKPVALHANP